MRAGSPATLTMWTAAPSFEHEEMEEPMNNTVMELAGAPFLHTMGILGMTFIGFSAIVMLLRQTLGRRLRPFDALFAHVYMEFGLVVSVGAMLPHCLRSGICHSSTFGVYRAP